MKVSSTYAAVAALSAVANARRFVRMEPAEPTGDFEYPADGVSPRPTQGAMELFRRADDETTLMASDNTCGYISGREGAAYTCNGDYSCAFVISNSASGNVGCCSASSCVVRHDCVDFDDYYSSSACDDGCALDALTLKCTGTAAPYCNTISFSGGITDYWCNNLEIDRAQAATSTWSSGDERVYTTVIHSTTEEATTSSVESSSTASGSSTRSTVVVVATNNTDSNNSDSKSSNTGAIAGGVVGGVAGLALIGAAIFFFMRNKKKKEAAAAAAAAATTPPAYQAPPMQQQPGVGPNGYNPVPQGQTGYYDPKTAYTPSPVNQYQQPTGFYPQTPDAQHDPRMSAITTSPTPSYNQQGMVQGQPMYQPQQTVIHEAPADNHGRNETHELA